MKQISRADGGADRVAYEDKHFEPVSYVDGRSSNMEKSPDELLKQIRREDLERQQHGYYSILACVSDPGRLCDEQAEPDFEPGL